MTARTSIWAALSLMISTVAGPANAAGFKDTKVGQWAVDHAVDKGANQCDMVVDKFLERLGLLTRIA
jgi:hypothetical protein